MPDEFVRSEWSSGFVHIPQEALGHGLRLRGEQPVELRAATGIGGQILPTFIQRRQCESLANRLCPTARKTGAVPPTHTPTAMLNRRFIAWQVV